LKKPNRQADYRKYLLTNKFKSPQKTNNFNSEGLILAPESITDSGFTEAEYSSIMQSFNQGTQANKILVFPYKKMMPHVISENLYPRFSEEQILSAAKHNFNHGNTEENVRILMLGCRQVEDQMEKVSK